MKWVLAEHDAGVASALAQQAGLHPLIARLMAIRGITEETDARFFLSCELSSLSDPYIFRQMEKAIGRIRMAIAGREKIIIYGDYDVDGVSGTSLLYLALEHLGANVSTYIPDRMSEGYGLNADALDKIKNSGVSVVISVDCGITATTAAETARSIGLDLIITDHHELACRKSPCGIPAQSEDNPKIAADNSGYDIPAAYAVLHPALLLPNIPMQVRQHVDGLTGVGIAFKLVQALLGVDAGNDRLRSYLDLVALGTVADLGQVTGENRILVRHGLDVLSANPAALRPGIAELIRVAGLEGKKIGVGTIGFSLAPRINASGRLEHANKALRLLITNSAQEAKLIAVALDQINRERQTVEESIWEEARGLCRQRDLAVSGAFVLSSGQWHPGVIGIVASRIVEEFYRPTALICVQDGVGKGSARSIPGFDLYAGLAACSDLLLGFGGHKYAAGFSITAENVPRLQERLNALVLEQLGSHGFLRTIAVDCAVTLDELTIDLMQEIDKLAPFGQGNPEPKLGARGLAVVSARIVGKNHLKLRLKQGNGPAMDAIAFNRGSFLGSKVKDGVRLAAVFTPRLHTWNGSTSVELDIRDIKIDK